MKANANDKASFCRSFEWIYGSDITWLDKTGIERLPDGRVVRYELETHGCQGTYVGFLVTILNPREGKIDSKMFLFDDYMNIRSNRSDDRLKGPHAYHDGFVVISNLGWRWYIAEPKTTRPFCEAVRAYVEAFCLDR